MGDVEQQCHFVRRNTEWWHENDDIPKWTNHYALFASLSGDLAADAFFWLVGSLLFGVAHEFDPDHEAALSDVGYMDEAREIGL